jgi:hypothetical protein
VQAYCLECPERSALAPRVQTPGEGRGQWLAVLLQMFGN